MGRPQHRVRNSNSESRPPLEDACPLWMPCWVRFHNRGGRDDEQARQSGAVVLEFRDMSFDFRGVSKASIRGIKQSYARTAPTFLRQLLAALPTISLNNRHFPGPIATDVS